MDINQLRELLKTDLVTVTFTKLNGTKREMHCTMLPEYLPPPRELNPNIKYSPSPVIVTAWDLEQNEWRSFKFDSVLSIETDYFNYVVDRAGSNP